MEGSSQTQSIQRCEGLQDLLNTLLDTIVDGVITINHNGIVQSYNRACQYLFGYRADEVVGCNVSMLMPELYHSAHDCYIDNYLRSEEPKITGIGREVSGRRKDGSMFPMDLAVGATGEAGEHAFVIIIQDSTEQKRAEEERRQLRQLQKMEAIGHLTSGIAHDFNNLLAVMLGNLDLLMEHLPTDDPLRARVQPCIHAAEQGASLIDQLLGFARKQTFKVEVLQLNDMVFYLSALMKRTLGPNIEIITDFSSDLWPIEADSLQLQNAILNLSVNARDAMPEGGSLVLRTLNIKQDSLHEQPVKTIVPGDYVMLSIIDTGQGIAQEHIDKVFEPFFSTKGLGKGTGMGLSMVYGFIKQSQGYIHLDSEVGKGTTVRLYFPRTHGELEADKVYRSHEEYRRLEMNPRLKTVLVVEDEAEVRHMTTQMVEQLGYQVLSCESGERALDMLQAHTVDALLSDVMLAGGLNGPKLAEKALALYPDLKIVLNTGYADQDVLEEGTLAQHVRLLRKPFRQHDLSHTLRALFEQ